MADLPVQHLQLLSESFAGLFSLRLAKSIGLSSLGPHLPLQNECFTTLLETHFPYGVPLISSLASFSFLEQYPAIKSLAQ